MAAGPIELPLLLGPRDDWFTDEAVDLLATHDFTVTPDTDRVGARLEGPELPRGRNGELPSEGVVLGALQVPTSGRPTLFLADHPVTGGYPVIGVVPTASVDRAAQRPPARWSGSGHVGAELRASLVVERSDRAWFRFLRRNARLRDLLRYVRLRLTARSPSVLPFDTEGPSAVGGSGGGFPRHIAASP